MLKKVPAPSSPEQLQDRLPPLTIPSPPGTFDHAPFGDDGFQVGDFVKISSDAEAVKLFQTGHGEWVESMIHVREGAWLTGKRGGACLEEGDLSLQEYVGTCTYTCMYTCSVAPPLMERSYRSIHVREGGANWEEGQGLLGGGRPEKVARSLLPGIVGEFPQDCWGCGILLLVYM